MVWCPKPLANLGESIRHIAVKAVADFAVGEFLKQTLLHTLLAAWTYPSYVVKALSCIDSPWTIGLDRAGEAVSWSWVGDVSTHRCCRVTSLPMCCWYGGARTVLDHLLMRCRKGSMGTDP